MDIDAFCAQVAVSLTVPYTPLIHGFCMSISATCLAEVGLFDEESFPRGYGEENDFCFRAGDAGFMLAVAIDTYVFHAKSKSYGAEERIPLMKAGMIKLIEKHSSRRVTRAVEYMRQHPTLVQIRQQVQERFYIGIA
jgi:GT2 family glycosyltransferase